MLKLFKFLIIFVFCCRSSFAKTTECQIPIGSSNEWRTFWPLAFHLNGSLYQTNKYDDAELSVWIPKNEELYLSCGPNYISLYADQRLQSIKVKCDKDGQFLTSDHLLKSAKQLKCDLRTIEEVNVSVEGCPKNSNSGQYGYIHPLDNSVRIVGESCYNINEGRTLFGHIRLGQPEESLVKEVLSKEFFRKPHPSSTYKIEFMRAIRLDKLNERFQKLLNNNDPLPTYSIANFIDHEYLLSNQQLIQTKKLVWNYFAVHDDIIGNLKALKSDISELGKTVDIDVYIGSHGITKLPNSKGAQTPIYLDDDNKKFPIPELIWIVVKNGKKAAAFGVINNPSEAVKMSIESPCKRSKCNEINWLINVRAAAILNKSINDDSIVCCEYDEFRGIVKEVPRMTDITEFYI